MRWFGFGFNAFQQIQTQNNPEYSGLDAEERLSSPTELKGHVNRDGRCFEFSQIRASWSRRASLHSDDAGCVCVAGFVNDSCRGVIKQSRGCRDVFISESHLTLAFLDRVECWDLQSSDETPSWTMGIDTQSKSSAAVNLPLVPGGYIASKPPFFHSLSPHMQAKSLALGGEHVILLTATGAVYTWGQGSHGQLGHGGLLPEEEPRTVEALWGMKMSSVSAGGWHSVCISDAGDLYVWGWNESGQLGLPSQRLRKTSEKKTDQQEGELSQNSSTHQEEVFISIQAFPALFDVTPLCEVKTVSCGSRHTAAVTTSGDLYTWGWGEYGQLGHQSFSSSDEPQRVEFFRAQQLHVVGVVCGPWNTFAAVANEEGLAPEYPTKPLNKHGE
ncbi:RCC1 domain-containing protein 1 isoform X1 [Oryzias latipes]|uniref:RCC1 domain-containing protein 1 isoform X1 n=1 Tax=Oryzias latipes TaxID=8090 RepID=UPI0002A4AE7D|nr:RCC1 domain-containing protein 1 isoform X1 [Oryzias latipes]